MCVHAAYAKQLKERKQRQRLSWKIERKALDPERLKEHFHNETDAKKSFQSGYRLRDAQSSCFHAVVMIQDLWDGGTFKKATNLFIV
jgi:hypothetical protein